jgi:anaerobic selenocysteine-containing dehydrogenase
MQETTLTRRSFVKAATVAGAALALSTRSTGSLEETDRAWAAEGDAGQTMYVSVCHGCIQACPCKVYVRNGVVEKIEGHPDAPTNQGSLCLKGLNQIHTCYSPRRVLFPLRRTGDKGAANASWEQISWDEAIKLASEKIAESIKKYGTYSFFASVGGGGAYSFMQAMTTPMALGSPTVFEPGCAQCYLPRIAIAGYMYGGADQSIADCAVLEPFKGLSKLEEAKGVSQDTKVLVLWAAQPSVSQTAQSGRGMAELRARGCKTIVVDPNFSPDAVKATIHLPVRPGSDDALILAWYRIILDEELYNKEFTKFFTNMPVLINPDTKLPWHASEVFADYISPTPDNTPVYVCVDEKSGEIRPLPFGDPKVVGAEVDPKVLATALVNGAQSRTAAQIYRDEADPWTLEAVEKFCWVPADRIRAAIDLYTHPEGGIAGIANGVASDMEETASQVPLGLCGLDMIMGYVNKPGATLTQNGPLPPDGTAPRPTRFWNGFGGMFGQMYGIGYEVGATQEANEARIAAIPEAWDPSLLSPPFQTQATLYALNQLLIDRLGMKNHKGLYEWCHSHIPTVREAIETGEPFHPRVWFDMSGNKFAVLGSAGAWYNAILNKTGQPEGGVDFVIAQYPMLTSFQIEVADLVFPLEEWLEATNASEFGQLNYSFPSPGVIHLGETVPNSVPPYQVINATAKLLNESSDPIVFGALGAPVQDMPPLTWPLGLGVLGGINSEADAWTAQIDKFKADPVLGPKLADVTDGKGMLAAMANDPDFYTVTPPEMYWTYDQHLVIADDGLPMGFATESRKCEVYSTLIIKMGRNGFPYVYPRPQLPCDENIYTWHGDYSPICNVPQQKEAPDVENAGEFTAGFDPEFPLAITSGRVYYFHHGTMRHAPFARELYPVPDVRINPKTAERYDIKHGDWVQISSRRTQGADYNPATKEGTKTAEPIFGRAYVAEVVAPDVLWMERFWNPECYDSTQKNKTGGWQECNVNVITNAVDAHFNEVFGSYTNRGFTVNIKKVDGPPTNIWIQPKEFEPFMPSTTNEYTPNIGTTIASPLTPEVAFVDPMAPMGAAPGGGA